MCKGKICRRWNRIEAALAAMSFGNAYVSIENIVDSSSDHLPDGYMHSGDLGLIVAGGRQHDDPEMITPYVVICRPFQQEKKFKTR